MIFVGLGGNLPSPRFGSPKQTLQAALLRLTDAGAQMVRLSPWYRSAPVPASDQPWFINAVAQVDFAGSAVDLLRVLHAIEEDFGRVRIERWEARVVDLDVLEFHAQIVGWKGGYPEDSTSTLVLPHPRLHERLFVLRPLADIAPGWRHPVLGMTPPEMLERLPPGQSIERCGDC